MDAPWCMLIVYDIVLVDETANGINAKLNQSLQSIIVKFHEHFAHFPLSVSLFQMISDKKYTIFVCILVFNLILTLCSKILVSSSVIMFA